MALGDALVFLSKTVAKSEQTLRAGQPREIPAPCGKVHGHGSPNARLRSGDPTVELLLLGGDLFRGRRGRRGAQVRDEVGDRPVRFVPDGRYRRNLRGGKSTGNALVVEGCEILG